MASNMFESYGGFARVSRVVSAFYDKVLDSPKLSHFFDGIDMKRLVDHQTKFIATVMGGPASYSNEALQRAHSNLKIDKAAFAEMVELLEETLEDFDFAQSDIDAVLEQISSRSRFVIAEA